MESISHWRLNWTEKLLTLRQIKRNSDTEENEEGQAKNHEGATAQPFSLFLVDGFLMKQIHGGAVQREIHAQSVQVLEIKTKPRH